MNQEENDEDLLRIQAKKSSDLFALNEGRRPRLLIGTFKIIQEKKLHKLAGLFADLGCNVDIAPDKSDLAQIQRQCLENDTDMLLIIIEEYFPIEQFHDFQTGVSDQLPHIIASYHMLKPCDNNELLQKQNSWSIFDQNDRSITIVSTLLKKLVSAH